MGDVDVFTHLIIELIELNEKVINNAHYDAFMDKRLKAISHYELYESQFDRDKLTASELNSIELLQCYLRRSNVKVIELLRVRLINLRIKQRIFEDRQKDL